jgi:hypothetical protein
MFHVFRDDARRRLTVTVTGAVTFGDMVLFVEQQLAQNAWSYSVLYDTRAMTTAVTTDEIGDVASHVQTLTDERRGPVAVVVAPGHAALVEHYASLARSAGIEFELFSDMPPAERWLESRTAAI